MSNISNMAELTGINIPSMNWSATDLPTAFREFRQYCELIFSGPLAEKTNKQKVTYLLLWVGQEGLNMYHTWTLSEEEKGKPKVIWEKFEKQLEPKTNFRLERYHLQKFKQGDSESTDEFMTRCKLQAQKCKFRDNIELEERLIEQLVIGAKHRKVQEKLLGKDGELKLDEALDIARTCEATMVHMDQLLGEKTVNAVSHRKPQPAKSSPQNSGCGRCGLNHPKKPRDKCPAHGSICGNCGKPNHWAKLCTAPKSGATGGQKAGPKPKPQGRYGPQKPKSVHDIQGEEWSPGDEEFETVDFHSLTVHSVRDSSNRDTRDEIFVKLEIELEDRPRAPATLTAKVDSGAQGNILPIRLFRQMYPNKVDAEGFPKPGSTTPQQTVLNLYGRVPMKQYGTCRIPCKYGEHSTTAEFFVVNKDGPAILGLPTCRALRLITVHCAISADAGSAPQESHKPINTKDDLIAMYPDRFEGIGRFPGEYHIVLDPTQPPVIHAPRKCPIKLKDDIKTELDEMERLGVIKKVTEPTDWVNSAAYSRKSNGRLRICLDPKDLNRAIKRNHHVTPTLEEITHKFAGSEVFSKVDARHGYWSVVLDEESSLLTTFNSPFGRYRYLRMPFGLKMSQDVFQHKMDQILEKCPGCIGIADDVGVFGRDAAEHDRNLHNLMQVARQHGLVFNPDKCEIRQDRIKFYGLYFDKEGVHTDPEKVADVKDMAVPTDVKGLQQFLGIATYMSPFIPHLSQHTADLRELIKKGSDFEWTASHDASFQKVKDLICQEVTLSYFDPSKEVTLQVDASLKGLGATLLQEGKPVAFCSKALNDCEQRYANIEREMLAVVYGCERFHTYLFGREFVVESDHKPLESIHLKNLTAAPPRLQRMLLRLQPYDLTIRYRPGKEVLLADALSRLSPRERGPVKGMDVQIHLVQFSSDKMRELRDATNKDSELSALRETIIAGWPELQKEVPSVLKPYWPYRDELSVENGLVMKSDRVVIPKCLQPSILSTIHSAHQGIEKCKLRARTCVFWNNINKDIEALVSRCPTCQEHQRSQQHETLMPHEIPTRTWQIVGTDIFHHDGEDYLLICDYYSKFPFIKKLAKMDSQTVVDCTKDIFSEQGIPERVISDNGRQYDCSTYRQFAKEWGFDHVTSSPHYPRSNGFAERQIQTVKKTLIKAQQTGSDYKLALLCVRSTPIDNQLPSPGELLYHRKLRSNLPIRVHTSNPNSDTITDRLQTRQDSQKAYHDTCAKDLPPLVPGQHVRIQDHTSKQWTPAVVASKTSEPRSYTVQTPNKNVLRRNRHQIRETGEKHPRVSPTRDSDPPAITPAKPAPQSTVARAESTISSSPPVCPPTPPVKGPDPYVTRYGRCSRPPPVVDV